MHRPTGGCRYPRKGKKARMDATLKVLIADDHPLMLHGIRRALEAAEDIDVVGEARSGDEVLALVDRRKPVLVLLDLHMPGIHGPAAIEETKRAWPDVKIVAISTSDDPFTTNAALMAVATAHFPTSAVTR